MLTTTTLIDGLGTYKCPSVSAKLDIWVDASAIVNYKLTDDKSGNLILSGNAGSKFSRWYLLFSTDAWLWVYSGDVGSHVWILQSDGHYKRALLADDKKLIKKMPAPFFKALPNTQKQSWADIR